MDIEILRSYAVLSRLDCSELGMKKLYVGDERVSILDGTSQAPYSRKDLKALERQKAGTEYMIRCLMKGFDLSTKKLKELLGVEPTLDPSGNPLEDYCAAPPGQEMFFRILLNYQLLKSGKGFLLYTWRTAHEANLAFGRKDQLLPHLLDRCLALYEDGICVRDIY